ncbi:O-antigen translocase [Rhodanobacter sp. 115]|uniref:O-antigen translocase n=1 Tax=Rhodanobacter sp. FW021-MT20 TaxID=1162282 RepID=UPI000260D299|nr:O-antigen translocase [Rhodanobacter sp. 115]EIL95666.1 polysaccharide biosynthesis protein [Rhodanobacter sp. 115]
MANSYRQILRSSSIIGGASVINILISLLRTKAAALLLGPAGVGLIGLFQNLVLTASAVASLGFGSVGTRQIAEAVGQEDNAAAAAARRALFLGTLVLAFIGGIVFWMLRAVLAKRILGNPALTGDVGWLTLGVVLTVAAGSQAALLNGLRKIGDIARVSVSSAVLSTTLGVGALWLWGAQGLLAFVLAAPLASFVMGHLYVARLPKVVFPRTPFSQLMSQWNVLVRLGAAFMVAGAAGTLGQLVVRALVQRELGSMALGQFQAAWAISMTYIGFVLAAMGTDYYPRLTAAIGDHVVVNRMVNEQTEVAFLLAGPVFLVMLALAPWLIKLLYSSEFVEATLIFRWQVLGDVLKVASWPLGFIILASGDGRTYVLTESSIIGIFVALVWCGLPLIGVEVTGVAFFIMYLLHLPLMYWLARRRTGFRWDSRVRMQLLVLVLMTTLVHALAGRSVTAAAVIGVFLAISLGVYALNRLSEIGGFGGDISGWLRKTLCGKR